MLGQLLLQERPAGEALVTPRGSSSWVDLRRLTLEALVRLEPLKHQRAILVCEPIPQTFAALAGLDTLDAEVVLADEDLLADPQLTETIAGAAIVHPDPSAVVRLEESKPEKSHCRASVILLTSGTTGRPKEVRHTWQSLAAGIRPQMASGGRWASGYRLRLFASLQVLLQAWTAQGVFITSTPAAAGEFATYWSRSRAEYASATPSFWRRLLMSTDHALLARIPLRQITLGGEAADQPLLDALRAAFVGARITHIYATTELGRCFAVSDGRAGFPASFLDGSSEDRPRLLVDHDELLVQRTAKGPWISTGDLVRIDGDRVQFTGRLDDLLNVGGQKVAPIDVERVLREAPGVVDVRVFGRRSALMGHLVACEIVVADGYEPDVVKRAVASHARERLSQAEQPRFVEVVNRVGVSSADKIIRRESES